MPVIQEEVARESGSTNSPRYEVGERVLWRALRNSPQHYMPGEKLSGTVIDVFDNAGAPTYRIRLELAWNATAIGEPLGQPVVVGNVREGAILPLAD